MPITCSHERYHILGLTESSRKQVSEGRPDSAYYSVHGPTTDIAMRPIPTAREERRESAVGYKLTRGIGA